MKRSLYIKLIALILLLIVSLMLVAGAFLVSEIRTFYLNDFSEKMKTAFENQTLAQGLYSAANDSNAPLKMEVALKAYAGQLGIDSRSRNYYILSGTTGTVLKESGSENEVLEITPNILTAIGGKEGYSIDHNASYIDIAIPVKGNAGNYIVYIKDNKTTARELTSALIKIIGEALMIGLVITVLLGLLLAKAMVTPIQNLTSAAERVAAGDFSPKLNSEAQDEIGVLTRTFNRMSGQLKQTLDDLKKSEATRREFVANVSHELRTPITSIRSYAETLQDSEDLPDDTEQEFLGVIVKESDRMTKIVQDLLTLSRFDAGSFEFSFERFSFEKSIHDVYNMMQLEAQKHGHNFTLDFETPIPEITGDMIRIEQVLINMVSNAIKYTRDGGNINITAGKKDETVWVSVKDNGIGIPDEDVPKVFDRFYRVDKARSRDSGGTGLGLSIANEIVARHSGKIEISSQSGKGTTITMTLPVEGPKHEG